MSGTFTDITFLAKIYIFMIKSCIFMAYNVKSYKKSGFCKRNPDLAIFHKVSQGCLGSTVDVVFRRQNVQKWVLFLRIKQNRRMGPS